MNKYTIIFIIMLLWFNYLNNPKKLVSESFLSPVTSEFVGSPAGIQADEGALYFYDRALKRITKVDTNGEKQLTFGREGSGPGEFESVVGFWVFEERYMIYDYNAFRFNIYHKDGSPDEDIVINENPVHPDRWPPAYPVSTEALNTSEVLVPSQGKGGSLVAVVNIETDSIQFLGSAVGDYLVGSVDRRDIQGAYAAGEIPDIVDNQVAMGGNQSAVYSFQQITGILEKYDRSGRLLWEKYLKVPAQETMFDQFAEENKKRAGDPEQAPISYHYARDIEVHDDGVAVLLNMPDDDHPLTLVWVPADGGDSKKITYSGITYSHLPRIDQSFSISPCDETIYFVDFYDGIIHKAEWPF